MLSTTYMDVQQAINLALFECLAQESIAFAYPTRTMHHVYPDAAPAMHSDAGAATPAQEGMLSVWR